jgi:hypothetical protein
MATIILGADGRPKFLGNEKSQESFFPKKNEKSIDITELNERQQFIKDKDELSKLNEKDKLIINAILSAAKKTNYMIHLFNHVGVSNKHGLTRDEIGKEIELFESGRIEYDLSATAASIEIDSPEATQAVSDILKKIKKIFETELKVLDWKNIKYFIEYRISGGQAAITTDHDIDLYVKFSMKVTDFSLN